LSNPIQLAPPVGNFILLTNWNFPAKHATHSNSTSSPGKLSGSRHNPRQGKPLLAAAFRNLFHEPRNSATGSKTNPISIDGVSVVANSRAERATIIAKASGIEKAIQEGNLPRQTDTTLSEALILGPMLQDVTRFLIVFGHGHTRLFFNFAVDQTIRLALPSHHHGPVA
jgi:hypothetical protein